MSRFICCLLVAFVSIPSYGEPYKWERIKVKVGKSSYCTVRIDYGLLKQHDKHSLDRGKFIDGYEIIKHTTTVPNVPNLMFGIVARVSSSTYMHAVAIVPKLGGKKDEAPLTRTVELKSRPVTEGTSFVLMVTPDEPPGKIAMTVYIDDVKVKTIDFDVLPLASAYTNIEKGFAIEFPADWTQGQDRDGEGIIAKSPKEGPDDKFLENICVSGMGRIGQTTSKGYRQFSESVLALFPDFKKIDSGRTKINNMTAQWTIYTCTDEDAKSLGLPKVKAMIYFIVKGDDAYMIKGTATEESFDKYRPLFEQTIQSFRLLDGK